jgi:lipopolysaccharide export system protein LptA
MVTVNGKSELQTVDATGGVLITTEKETARGSQGKYNAKTGIATLTGSVTLTRGQNVLQGGLATVNMKTGVSSLSGTSATDGKARAVFSPGSSSPTE